MGEIKTGQKVKLSIDTADGSKQEFDCYIKDFHHDRLTLNYPKDILNYSEYFEEGSELSVKVFTPIGVRVYESIVLDSPFEGDFVIEYVENSPQIQRREYVRILHCLKVVVEKEDKNTAVAYTVDISGGGIKFVYDGDFRPGESVKLTMYLPDVRAIQCYGTILKNEHIPKNEHVLFFTEIDEKERDRLIKLCFDLQTNPLEI